MSKKDDEIKGLKGLIESQRQTIKELSAKNNIAQDKLKYYENRTEYLIIINDTGYITTDLSEAEKEKVKKILFWTRGSRILTDLETVRNYYNDEDDVDDE